MPGKDSVFRGARSVDAVRQADASLKNRHGLGLRGRGHGVDHGRPGQVAVNERHYFDRSRRAACPPSGRRDAAQTAGNKPYRSIKFLLKMD